MGGLREERFGGSGKEWRMRARDRGGWRKRAREGGSGDGCWRRQ